MKLLKPDENLEQHIEKKLRIEKKGVAHEGVLKGRSHLAVMADAKAKPVVPWLLLDGTNEYHFTHPGDGWTIHLLD